MVALGANIGSLMANLHSFFKTSTARRADMIEVREDLAEARDDLGDELEDAFEEILDQFFIRHIEVRWLQAEPCIDRILQHWESTLEYFSNFLPNSKNSSDKKSLQGQM